MTAGTDGLRLTLLGELALTRQGTPVALPASRKTRALLGYLAVTGRPHRRERLCELLWELPDDPRGALRWSLSKLRGLVDSADVPRIRADRERVALVLDPGEADLPTMRATLAPGAPPLSAEALETMAVRLEQPLLDGLDIPDLDAWQAWLQSEREECRRLRLTVLQRLAGLPEADAEAALQRARSFAAAAPGSQRASALLAAAAHRFAGQTGGGGRSAVEPGRPMDAGRHQQIGFCRAADGVRIAHARVGEGPPLVKAANWLNHLELDWASPIWGDTFAALARRRTLIRYDERGNGLSDWDAVEISFDAFVTDLETVVDALALNRFPLLGLSQGCAVSVAYAVRHPERVSALILIGGYAAGWRIGASPDERERREAVMTLTRLGWGSANPAYRRIFSQTFMPDATHDELVWFDEFQRQTTSPANAVRFQDAFGDIDVRPLLAKVRCPTLVLHARGDQRITLEQGRELAIGIPQARFVALDSRNHILLGHEPAWHVAMAEIDRFLTQTGA